MARATAVFDDVSKIGGGYATCRDAYNTCMDQFCAKANEKYRRCFCSARFTQLVDKENGVAEAQKLLQQFENNDLNAVNKSAAEVLAMYTATDGEAAITKDTSSAAQMLSEVGELLSGKKKASAPSSGATTYDFTSASDIFDEVDGIWSGSSQNIFATSQSSNDLDALEGQQLYNSAHKQCMDLIAESCENDAVKTMAKSSYSILITQDCNTYEKSLDKQQQTLLQAANKAEQYLRQARLEEYQSHNSADVNECMSQVKKAITTDNACGTDYIHCLDGGSGRYIDQQGEPIYSAALFQLTETINLNVNDVLADNPSFDTFLDGKRMYAASALDTCREIADTVWKEFKRSAIIEIAQAQAEKIEEVKMSCVKTMSECYDTQSGALKDMHGATAANAAALAQLAAKQMCQEKVVACAALYGNNKACKFDNYGRIDLADAANCGLTALLNFVDSVDDARFADGCATSINKYLTDTCTPSAGDMDYPWKCNSKKLGTQDDSPSGTVAASLYANVIQYAIDNCTDPSKGKPTNFSGLNSTVQDVVRRAVETLGEELDYQMMEACEELDGYWDDSSNASGTTLVAYYSKYYGGNTSTPARDFGTCVQNNTMMQCLAYNTSDTIYATYDKNKDECNFNDAWYTLKCESLGGYYEAGACYVAQ